MNLFVGVTAECEHAQITPDRTAIREDFIHAMLRLWTGQRCCRYFQRCLSSTLSRRYTRKKEHYDVVIAGGGIMGCSSAYFLAQRVPPESVCIIERDPKVSCLCSYRYTE